jgi:acetyl esterase/lipase
MASFRIPHVAVLLLAALATHYAGAATADATVPQPEPLEAGKTVIPLWPADKLSVKGDGGPEVFTRSKNGRVQSVVNIHNPSIELRLASPEKRNGTAIILIPGGGNHTVVVGSEGIDAAAKLNELGISAFILRYRIQPYESAVEGLADTARAVRTVRAHAKEWGVDPDRIGVMGFSAGGEQAAWIALKFDRGDSKATDVVDQTSSRPDFVVMIYAGWKNMDMSNVPKDAPPTFLTSAGADDAFHARQTVQFYSALFEAGVPAELHIYGHGGHGGAISPRGGIPFGTWDERFVDWARDIKMLPKK